MNEYQRNGSPESSVWKTDQDKFQGYVRAKLEDMRETQCEQQNESKSIKKRVIKLESKAQYAIGGLMVINSIIVILFAAYSTGLIHF